MLCEMTYIGDGWCKCSHCANRAKTANPELVRAECRSGKPEKPPGPGAHLRAILKRLGFKEAAGCDCKGRAATMDRMGPDWCEENIDTIVGWLRAAANKQGRKFLEWPARQLVKLAIKRARASPAAHP